MAKLIGNAPNQISTNGDLGSMAFEDKKNYATTSSPIYQPFRNIIINGDMSIAQRGTSVSSITTGGYKTLDRFDLILDSLGTWTMSQDTDVPTGQGFAKSLKLDCTSADGSPSAGDRFLLRQQFEGQNLQYLKKGTSNASSLTASFWVKSVKTGTYIVQIADLDNTRSISKSYTINSANTWEKKTITFDGDTTGTLDNDNNSSLSLSFWLGAGSTWSSGTLQTSWGNEVYANIAVGQVNLADSTSNEWYITGVQLEAGQVASDFEFLPFDVNYKRCQRYYQRIQASTSDEVAIGMGYSDTTSGIRYYHTLSTTMRGIPSASENGLRTLGRATLQETVDINAVFDVASENPEVVGLDLAASSGTPFTQFDAQMIRLDDLDNAYLEFNAEL